MNLRRQAIAYFAETKPRAGFEAVFAESARLLSYGESFLMPNNGYLFEANKEQCIALSDLHLPFEVCILEWDRREEGEQAHLVCRVYERDDLFEIAPALKVNNVWYPICLVLKVPKAQSFETFWNGSIYVNKIAAEAIPLTPYAPAEILDAANYLHEVKVVAQFLLAANCGNVAPVKIHEPSAKQMKAAEARGNLPFNSYWALDCSFDQDEDPTRSMGGSHATPRLHVRRGHIRHLPSGKLTWVRQCLVGNPDRGVVEKHYEIGSTAQNAVKDGHG